MDDPKRWKFEKLSDKNKNKIVSLYNEGDLTGILRMHNTYKLTNTKKCCTSNSFLNHIEDAIKKGILTGA